MKDFSFNLWNKVGQVIMKFRMIDNIYFFQFEDLKTNFQFVLVFSGIVD